MWVGRPSVAGVRGHRGVALEKLVLTDLGGGRTRLAVTALVDSFEGRVAVLSSGVEVGLREGYERLDELVAR